MASILDRYGIKEVADVTFYELDANGKPTKPVLFLDTLKVSTIEQTAEQTDARGGKGNAKLITWDYGKEINVTLEDALFSPKSMAIMLGNGQVTPLADNTVNTAIMKTETFTATSNFTSADNTVSGANASDAGWSAKYIGPNGYEYTKQNPKFYTADGSVATKLDAGEKYFCSFDLRTQGAAMIEVSADSFPGTYYITGDTYARNEASGKDEFFQFIIPKAKMSAENTITLEAEGDPSVFNLNLSVLRPANGVMMQLVKYDLAGGNEVQGESVTLIHNHALEPVTE